MSRRPTFEPFFTTHPSQVGSASLWTLFAAMLRSALSHPICRQTTTFCRFGAQVKVHRLGHLVFSQHVPTDVLPHSMTASRDKLHLTRRRPIHGHAPRPMYHVHASPQHVATYQVDLPILNFSSCKVTCPQFPSFNLFFFCARRINATRESLLQKLARRNNATTFLFL